jgi:tellurite methyltransferase
LDFGCGMGNLAVAAAKQGCEVLALDGSHSAIDFLCRRAASEQLAIDARVADLREYQITETYDAIVSIGLLMFFDCATARRVLANLQAHVRAGGVAVINVLVEGTTYLDMFDPAGHCLFARGEMQEQFASWQIISAEFRDFDAPGNLRKSFITLIAQKP